MHTYDFSIADLRIRVESPFAIPDLFELSSFLVGCASERQPDALYQIRMLPKDWQIQGKPLFRDRQNGLYELEGEQHRYFYWDPHRKERFVLLVRPCGDGPYTLYLHPEEVEQLLPQFRLSALFSMEQLLLRHGAFQLHASVIDWQGKGILFCAPSGTGKSTQAELWREYAGARILNGDRGILRCVGDRYRVYGSPYAGSSEIYTNLSVPVEAVVTLEQGTQNQIRRLNPMDAFRKLYREVTVSVWDSNFVDQISGALLSLIENVPVLHLTCRPDADAVWTLQKQL